MAKTKLTLFIEETVIERIKIRAVKEHTSVSLIVEALLRDYLKQAPERKT